MIKNLILVLSFLVFIGCSTTKELSNNKYSWVQLLDDEAYLQISPEKNAITEKLISFGSIIYSYKTESEYLTVYLNYLCLNKSWHEWRGIPRATAARKLALIVVVMPFEAMI